MSGYWKKTTTWPRRYHHFGVTDYILSRTRQKNEIVIIDVGCSTGEAMTECKKYLVQSGIGVYTIGIDSSETVSVAAKKNLDQFILSNVLDVNEHQKTADIVLCMNMERFVDWDVRSRIIRKCNWFLKSDGMLITGINKKHRKQLRMEQLDLANPDMVYADNSWKTQAEDLRRYFCIKDTRMISYSEALSYANLFSSDWQNISMLRRFYTKYLLTVL